jgi:hypothetical protein
LPAAKAGSWRFEPKKEKTRVEKEEGDEGSKESAVAEGAKSPAWRYR